MYTEESYNPLVRCQEFSSQYFLIIKDELTNQNARDHYRAWGQQATERAIADTILSINYLVFGVATLAQMAFESGKEFRQQVQEGWESLDAIPLYVEPVPIYALPAVSSAAIEVQAYQAIQRQSWKDYVLSCLGYQNGYGVITAGDRLEKAVRSLGGC